jgi:hypothetical protein
MQALDFTKALTEVAEDLHLKDLLGLIEPWLQPNQVQITSDQKRRFTQSPVSSNAAYEFLLRKETTRAVLEKLQIGELLEGERVTTLITMI